jgi:putative toxin-antitoxin system antitoxin component (TIGR02293 family)
MIDTGRIAQALGASSRKPVRTLLELDDAVRQGLPVDAVERVCQLVAPDDRALRHHLVARATLARREREGRLSPEESARVERLARVWTLAMDVWRDETAARRFLANPHPLLDGRRPLDVALTDLGAREVEEILGRLQYGSAA